MPLSVKTQVSRAGSADAKQKVKDAKAVARAGIKVPRAVVRKEREVKVADDPAVAAGLATVTTTIPRVGEKLSNARAAIADASVMETSPESQEELRSMKRSDATDELDETVEASEHMQLLAKVADGTMRDPQTALRALGGSFADLAELSHAAAMEAAEATAKAMIALQRTRQNVPIANAVSELVEGVAAIKERVSRSRAVPPGEALGETFHVDMKRMRIWLGRGSTVIDPIGVLSQLWLLGRVKLVTTETGKGSTDRVFQAFTGRGVSLRTVDTTSLNEGYTLGSVSPDSSAANVTLARKTRTKPGQILYTYRGDDPRTLLDKPDKEQVGAAISLTINIIAMFDAGAADTWIPGGTLLGAPPSGGATWVPSIAPDMYEISIVIPTENMEDSIEGCIQAVEPSVATALLGASNVSMHVVAHRWVQPSLQLGLDDLTISAVGKAFQAIDNKWAALGPLLARLGANAFLADEDTPIAGFFRKGGLLSEVFNRE